MIHQSQKQNGFSVVINHMFIRHRADLAPYKQSFILAINSAIYEVMPFFKCQGEQCKVLFALRKLIKAWRKITKCFYKFSVLDVCLYE